MSSHFIESRHLYQYTFIVYDHVAACTPPPSTGLPQGSSGPPVVDTSIPYEVSYFLVCPFCMSFRSRHLPSSHRSAPPSRSSVLCESQAGVSFPFGPGRAQMRKAELTVSPAYDVSLSGRLPPTYPDPDPLPFLLPQRPSAANKIPATTIPTRAPITPATTGLTCCLPDVLVMLA